MCAGLPEKTLFNHNIWFKDIHKNLKMKRSTMFTNKVYTLQKSHRIVYLKPMQFY